MGQLLHIFVHNWKLKLAAFALAMLLWITVSADQLTSRWLQVPVEVQIQDPNLELVTPPEPRDVRVRFAGTWRDLWDVMSERPPIRLVLTNAAEGSQELVLDPAQVVIPRARAAAVTALEIRPSTVRIDVLRVARADLPVQLVLRDTLPTGLAFSDSIAVEPGVVRVSGPMSDVLPLNVVHTRPLELPREAGEFTLRVPIDTVGLGNVRLSATEVVASGRIDRAVQVGFEDIPVQAPDGVLVVPGVVNVIVLGAESLVRPLAGRLRAVVPADALPAQLPAAGVDVPVRIEGVPPGAAATSQPRNVRVVSAPAEAPPEPAAPAAPAPATPVPPDTLPAGEAGQGTVE